MELVLTLILLVICCCAILLFSPVTTYQIPSSLSNLIFAVFPLHIILSYPIPSLLFYSPHSTLFIASQGRYIILKPWLAGRGRKLKA